MKILARSEYPDDFIYHRTGSPIYRKYLHGCWLRTFDIEHPPQFAWIKRVFGNWFTVIKYERTDIEPNPEYLKKLLGVKHAFVVWIPYTKLNPDGWKRLWFSDHFEETGYTKLEYNEEEKKTAPNPAYLTSWNDRARRARKRFLSSWATVREVSPEEFIETFRATKVRGPHKAGSIVYYKKLTAIDSSKVRQWMVYDLSGKPISGLAVHDFADHSVHLVAFTDRSAYDCQAWTGLIDIWFSDSLEKGFKYLSFDHLRNRNGPKDQEWYTKFKESFLTARLSFREVYFKFF